MPVKILREETKPQDGIIHISDVHRMLADFRKKVNVECTDPSRNPVQKRFHFDINFNRLKKIADSISGEKKIIRINLSLNLPGQLNCQEDESIENNLSILVCAVDKKGAPMLKVGNLVLAEGFLDNEKKKLGGGDDPCCVQGVPFPI